MKTNFNIFLILLTTTLAACINDYPSCDDCEIEMAGYSALRFKMSDFTHSEDNSDEISALKIFLLNDNDEVVCEPIHVRVDDENKNKDNEIIVPIPIIPISDTIKNPMWILVIVNPTKEMANSEFKKFSDITKISIDASSADFIKKGKFPMATSMVKNRKGLVKTILNSKNIYSTISEAEANAINVYVERLAAKLTVTADKCKFDIANSGDKKGLHKKLFIDGQYHEYKMKIIGAFVANEPLKTWYIKRLDNVDLKWMDVDNHRCHWAAQTYDKLNQGKNYNNIYKVKTLDIDTQDIDTQDNNVWTFYSNENTYNEDKGCKKPYIGIFTQIQIKIDGEFETKTIRRYNGFYFTKGSEAEKAYLECHNLEANPDKEWKEGKAYYATPAVHVWVNEKQRYSACGLVRNHYYKYNVESVKGMGLPIPEDGVEDPSEQDDNSLICFKMSIYDWNTAGDDDCELLSTETVRIQGSVKGWDELTYEVETGGEIVAKKPVCWKEGTYKSKSDRLCELIMYADENKLAECSFRMQAPKGSEWRAILRHKDGRNGKIMFCDADGKNPRNVEVGFVDENRDDVVHLKYMRGKDKAIKGRCMMWMEFYVIINGKSHKIDMVDHSGYSLDEHYNLWTLIVNE